MRVQQGSHTYHKCEARVCQVATGVVVAGVRNYVARNHLRGMQLGDRAFFYHSSCKVPGIVGIVEVRGGRWGVIQGGGARCRGAPKGRGKRAARDSACGPCKVVGGI